VTPALGRFFSNPVHVFSGSVDFFTPTRQADKSEHRRVVGYGRMDNQQGGQPGLAGGAANALQVEPAAPPPPQPQQAVVGAGPFVPQGAGSPPLPLNGAGEAAQVTILFIYIGLLSWQEYIYTIFSTPKITIL
jgi:hypothetical protein